MAALSSRTDCGARARGGVRGRALWRGFGRVSLYGALIGLGRVRFPTTTIASELCGRVGSGSGWGPQVPMSSCAVRGVLERGQEVGLGWFWDQGSSFWAQVKVGFRVGVGVQGRGLG